MIFDAGVVFLAPVLVVRLVLVLLARVVVLLVPAGLFLASVLTPPAQLVLPALASPHPFVLAVGGVITAHVDFKVPVFNAVVLTTSVCVGVRTWAF